MKSNSNSSNESRSPRVLSPPFRSGPRQRPSVASTEEIVRFVREYQRCKPPPPMHNVPGMKKRAVLPGIERKTTDVLHGKRSSILGADYRKSFESEPCIGNAASLNAESYCGRTLPSTALEPELQESDSEDEFDYNISGFSHGKKSHGCQNGIDFTGDQINDGRDLQNGPKQTRHSKSEVDLEVEGYFSRPNASVHNNNTTGNRQKRTQRNKRGNVISEPQLLTHGDNFVNFSSNQSLRQSGAMRPCALRQLPPIINKDSHPRAPRPSAPSPTGPSPTLQFYSSDSNSDGDVNDAEEDDDEQDDNIDKTSLNNNIGDNNNSSDNDDDGQADGYFISIDKYDCEDANGTLENEAYNN